MSRRGGGGGGRGRGGSKSTLSSSKEMLKRSASEAGLDDRHIKVLSDITRPPLFPDFLWKSTGHYWNEDDVTVNNNHDMQQQLNPIKTEPSLVPSPVLTCKKLPASMIGMINKQRELTKRFQNSAYYIRPSTAVDIVRYSDRMDGNKSHLPHRTPDMAVLASLSVCATNDNGSAKLIPTADDTKYFPEELLPIKKANIKRRNGQSSRNSQPKSDFSTATAVAIKLENLGYQEETGKMRTISITSNTSNDDLMLTVPAPAIANARKSSEADETVLDDMEDDEEDNEDDNHMLEEHVEEELGEDYTTNYYASDDENNDDDDGEPTY